LHQDEYRHKLITPQKAAELIQDNMTLAHGLTMAEPPGLLGAIAGRLRAGDLKKLKVFSLLPLKHALDTVLAPDLCDCVETVSGFVSGGERGLVEAGLNYYMPNHFHQVPRLLSEFLGVDVLVTTVSPMDKAGYFSFGTANDYTSTVARSATLCLVEVNPNMPRVFGDSLLHVSEVDAVVENSQPMLEMPAAAPKPEDEAIGKAIAEMVPDGACLQLGFGGLPNAVARFLEGHKDMGVHTEVFGPGMVHLIKKGAITGRKKNLHPRKHVFTVAQGDQDMLDFMDDNPAMASYPVSYTNRPEVIAQNDKMISINSIIQVDLLGQCNAEYLHGHQFSGTGGQLDFVRGAFDSPGGKSILAFHSTAKDGTVSRIVPALESGAMVTTPRMDTHHLVTEFGSANLKGRSSRERALAIIDLAAPQFRDELLRKAEDMYLL
jgi:itaconate CoA-transferase